jgi:hypothetical protein
MLGYYLRYGRRFPIPSTAQILDELKSGFVAGYVPISGGTIANPAQGSTNESAKTAIE